jgi:putative addiction module killer protein
MSYEVRRYLSLEGREPFTNRLESLPDRPARARVLARIERLEIGNFGDVRYLDGGMGEMRIDWGPGYRVYFGRDGQTLVLPLFGGDKRGQDIDIRKARQQWQAYAGRRSPRR